MGRKKTEFDRGVVRGRSALGTAIPLILFKVCNLETAAVMISGLRMGAQPRRHNQNTQRHDLNSASKP